MRFLKYLLILLIILIAIAVGVMAISPKTLNVQESIVIDAPKSMIFNYVSNLKNAEEWSPWSNIDPNMKIQYSGSNTGLGAISEWQSDHDRVGNGRQEIIEITANEHVSSKLNFEGFEADNFANWRLTDQDGKTHVEWDMKGGETPFVYRPFNLMMHSDLTNMYRTGLSSLKEVMEKRSKNKIYGGFKIQEVLLDSMIYLGNRQVVKMNNISQFYQQNLGSLFLKAQQAGLTVNGMPCGLFYKFDDNKNETELAAAIPVLGQGTVQGASVINVNGGRAVRIDYYGDYSGTHKAHDAIEAYLEDNKLFNDVPIIEEYVTDPSEEPDSEKWLTRISYKIAE